MDSNAVDGEFVAKLWGYPAPRFVWHDNNDNEISWDFGKIVHHKYEVAWDKRNGITKLKILNPDISDCGIYTLHANNGGESEVEDFYLFVNGMLSTENKRKWDCRTTLNQKILFK